MGVIINQGWLWLYSGSDYLKLYFDECKVDWKLSPKISHYAGEAGMMYDIKKWYLIFKCFKVWATSAANFASINEYLRIWQAAGTFTLKIVREGVSNTGIKFDGTNETYTVAIAKDGVKDMQKISRGTQEYFNIQMLMLEEV